MSEPLSDRNITVTAQERAHLAIKKLARAAIALARQLTGESPAERTSSPAPSPIEQSKEATAAISQERPHA